MHKNIPIVVGIIILFLGTCINPSIAIDNVKKSYIPISNNNTLYVGGTGGDNYTKIQDAIDNASDGDLVFVYSYSSPYYENLHLNKSISLKGEDKNITIIDGNNNGYVVYVSANWVNFSGFTIHNCGEFGKGILLFSNYNTISGNNIYPQGYWGILIEYSRYNIIKDNIISENKYGLFFHHSLSNTITGNYIISNKYYGISLNQFCNKTIIPNKNVSLHHFSSDTNIIYNNYFDNNFNAEDDGYNIWNISKTKGFNIIGGQWLGGNYWSQYTGEDLDGDGLGDTKLPHKEQIKNGGDWLPLTNQPPGTTIINGCMSGKPFHNYSYIFLAEDPNNDNVKYHIDWDDDNFEITEFNPSGTEVEIKHTWSEAGIYILKAKAEDTNGHFGPEGTLTVTIPRTRASFDIWYHWLLKQLSLFEKLLNLIIVI